MFTLGFEELSAKDSAIAGGKGASLGEMTRAGLPVPPGFVILSGAFDRFMLEAGLQNDKAAPDMRSKVMRSPMPPDISAEIIQQFKKLGAKYAAVRSSATSEDSAGAAWAGQLETYLNTTEKNLLGNVKKCWASLFLARAIFYQKEKGLGRKKISVAVVVQKMVESQKSGIAFSVHPITQDKNQMIIEAVMGLGETIVSGLANPDSYVLQKKPAKIIDRKIQDKKPVLSDAEIIKLANIIIRIEKHYGFPVDVEWAKENNKLYIVQSRPITTLKKQPAEIALPSKKDISYIQKLCQKYQGDIDHFDYPCLVLYACLTWFWTTDQAKKYFGSTIPFFFFFIKGGAGILEAPWYLGPGQLVMEKIEKEKQAWLKNNRRLLDQAEKKFLASLSKMPVKAGQKLDYYLALLRAAVKNLVDNQIHFQVATQIDKPLNQKLLQAFKSSGSQLSGKEIFDLSVSGRETDAIVHDKALAALFAWCQKNKIKLGKKSFEAGLENQTFKSRLQNCHKLGYFLRSGYGGVVLWSLKDEYLLLVASGKNQLPKSSLPVPVPGVLNRQQKFYLEVARHFSAGRDRRKSMQQRAFFHMARILEEIAKIIHIPRSDLECLRAEDFTKDFLIGRRIKKMITERKKGYLGFWSPAVGTWEWNAKDAEKNYQQIAEKYQGKKELHGACACPGHARGRVRIVFNPRLQKRFEKGEILVAGMTSPDYVPLMKKAAAIITEVGGITCHAAIISRELNIPCVIGTNIATKILKDKDLVEVDANRGLIRILGC